MTTSRCWYIRDRITSETLGRAAVAIVFGIWWAQSIWTGVNQFVMRGGASK